MEEALSNYFVDFVMTALGTAVFALIGFVWRISHKVTENQKKTEEIVRSMHKDHAQVNRDIDMILTKIDKQGEWTTNRMMSIAKELPRD
jgi:hypothetical protein